MSKSYPFFMPVLLPSVSLLSGGEVELCGMYVCTCGERKTSAVHHLYSRRHHHHRHHHHHHLHHLHVIVELVYMQRWGFCRFDKVVSRTQSSPARSRKFGNRLGELEPARSSRSTLRLSGLSRDSNLSLLCSSSSSSCLDSEFSFTFFSLLFFVWCHLDWRRDTWKCVNARRKYVHGGDARWRYVFRDALVRSAPSAFRPRRECPVSKYLKRAVLVICQGFLRIIIWFQTVVYI